MEDAVLLYQVYPEKNTVEYAAFFVYNGGAYRIDFEHQMDDPHNPWRSAEFIAGEDWDDIESGKIRPGSVEHLSDTITNWIEERGFKVFND